MLHSIQKGLRAAKRKCRISQLDDHLHSYCWLFYSIRFWFFFSDMNAAKKSRISFPSSSRVDYVFLYVSSRPRILLLLMALPPSLKRKLTGPTKLPLPLLLIQFILLILLIYFFVSFQRFSHLPLICWILSHPALETSVISSS